VPDTGAQVEALAKELGMPKGAALISDEQVASLYVEGLRTHFAAAFPSLSQSQAYNSSLPGASGRLQQIATDFCYGHSRQPPVVLFAGDATDLSALAAQFQQSAACFGRAVRIVTGSDADSLNPAITRSAGPGAQVSIEYTDIINLAQLTPGFKRAYQSDFAATDPALAGLADVWTPFTYNAMIAAWTAINAAYQATYPEIPDKAGVSLFAQQLNGQYAVPGAAGSFQLSGIGQLRSPDVPVYLDSRGQRTVLHS
jgi:hypothetical protein